MTQQAKDRWGDFFRHNLLTLLSMAGGLIAMMHWGDVTFIKFANHIDAVDTAVTHLKSEVSNLKKDVNIIKTNQDTSKMQTQRLQMQVNFIYKQLDYRIRQFHYPSTGTLMHTYDKDGNVIPGADKIIPNK